MGVRKRGNEVQAHGEEVRSQEGLPEQGGGGAGPWETRGQSAPDPRAGQTILDVPADV